MVKDLRLEDVDAGVDRVAEGFVDAGLFLEAEILSSVIGDHNAVAAHLILGDPFGDEAGEGTLLFVRRTAS